MLSIEEVRTLTINYQEEHCRFIEDAIENGCEFFKNIYTSSLCILKRTDELKELGDNIIGLYIVPNIYGKNINVWIAKEDSSDRISDGFAVGEFDCNESIKSIIAKSIKFAGTCDICKEFVGYKDMHHVGFANKCCSKCLKVAKEIYEYDGWTR